MPTVRHVSGIDLAMLCIRRPVYIALGIASINSLHYQNARHRVLVHVDDACFEELQSQRRKLDYPSMVEPIRLNDDSSRPWQFTKLDVVLDMASRGIPFVDADSRWHTDPAPLIPRDLVMFLVVVNEIGAVASERLLTVDTLCRPEWVGFSHFNTGFISVPARLYSEDFASEARRLARLIHESPYDERFTDEQKRMFRHTSEELALSLAVQAVIGRARISTLKEEDGPGSRSRLESYYYGALNRID
jgi:hypothetical protein